jgi:transposase
MDKKLSDAARDWKEGRRLRAWELRQAGWSQAAIANALGVTEGAVSQWLARAKQTGVSALYSRKAAGPTPRLTAGQRAQIPALLSQGAESYGFRGDLWTRERVAMVVQREFGVKYSPQHIGRLLRACGWTPQKPVKRATQRNEEAIQRRQNERWPEIKKRP